MLLPLHLIIGSLIFSDVTAINKKEQNLVEHHLLPLKEEIFMHRLWDGMDIEYSFDNSTHFELLTEKKFARAGTAGMFDSGTNLMDAYKILNFKAPKKLEFFKHLPPMIQNGVDYQKEYFEPRLKQFKKEGNEGIVAMVRNPISHLVSWKKAGYDLHKCSELPWETVLSSTCKFQHGRFPQFHFEAPGLVNVWNKYVRGYLELAEKHDNFMIVRFEDLVIDPEATVAAVAKFQGLKVPDPLVHVYAPAKPSGTPSGRSEALSKIQDHQYLVEGDMPIVEHLEQMCTSIDWSLVEKLPKLSKDVPSYKSDCEKFLS